MFDQSQASNNNTQQTLADKLRRKLRQWLTDPKRLSILIVVIIIALLLPFLLINRVSDDRQVDDGIVDILITEDGFRPSVVLVNPGTTVRWTNLDNQPHWVASNPHPEHSDLSGLDAGEHMGPEANYSYTFEDIGRYGYHDHLNPETNGIIMVEN